MQPIQDELNSARHQATQASNAKADVEIETEKLSGQQIEEYKAEVLDMIKRNVNRKYFKEAKLERFFKLLFALPDPDEFARDATLHRWTYSDLKFILQMVVDPEYLLQFSKFLVLYKMDDDPELLEILCDAISKRIKMFDID